MSQTDQSVEQIQRQMRQIRLHLDDDVGGIVAGAQQMTDWRRYVAAFPWGSVAAAAALGFLVIPRRTEIVRPDLATLEKLAKRQQLVVEPDAAAHAKKPSMAETAFNLLGNIIVRAGISYAGQQFGRIFGEQAGEPERVSK